MSKNEISKFIALILRHKPDAIDISLDEHGWANVEDLVAGIAKTSSFDRKMLEEIVAEDNKQRYSFNEDHTLIRANQGHSIPVDVELKKVSPPEILYHGSAVKYEAAIDEQGLLPKSRLYVHLSNDYETAINVGKRHGSPVVYRVKSKEMEQDGFDFFLSENGVWLTKAVPTKYLVKM